MNKIIIIIIEGSIFPLIIIKLKEKNSEDKKIYHSFLHSHIFFIGFQVKMHSLIIYCYQVVD